MRGTTIAAACLGVLGLAGPAMAAGFSAAQPTVAVTTDSIEFRLGQFALVPSSFALLGCEINVDGPEVRFLQLAGSGLTLGDRSVFVVDEAQGLPCAEVISELLRVGFVIDDSRLVVVGAANLVVYDLILPAT